jgi:hypothetical protein
VSHFQENGGVSASETCAVSRFFSSGDIPARVIHNDEATRARWDAPETSPEEKKRETAQVSDALLEQRLARIDKGEPPNWKGST